MTFPAPAGRVALLAFVVSFVVLVANGRAIGSGDTTAVENTAAALATRGTVVLPDNDAPDPFTRPVDNGRISIYPALPALLGAPLFAVFSLSFDLSPSGVQVAGKITAALMSAAATAMLAASFAQRAAPLLALIAALLFGLGTSVFSSSQALWQHPAVVLFLVIALGALERVEKATDPAHKLRPALIAALALSLAAAARPAAIPMCAALFLFLVQRSRLHVTRAVLAALAPAVAVGIYNATFFGAPWRFGPDLGGRFGAVFPESIAGLLISPARGLIVFTPIALIALWGLVTEARRTSLARGLLAAVTVHFVFMSAWNEWHGGESFGPRLLTDLLPALFFYLPEGLLAWPKMGAVLGALSVAVQLLGGWTYDYRWERLHQRGGGFEAALWSWPESPIPFALREGVLIQGVPEVEGRRIRLRPVRSVPFGAKGSTIEGTSSGMRIGGEPSLRDIRLERGARLIEGWITLIHPADAVAFRSNTAGARTLRLVGTLQGVLRVEQASGSVDLPMTGAFDVAVPIQLTAGEDIAIRAGSGELRLARVELR